MIEFLCPNGHRIRCQAEQAGRAAKCPRCGVKFRVPKSTDLEVSEVAGSDSKILRPEFVDSTGSSQKASRRWGGRAKGAPDRVPVSERASFARAGQSSRPAGGVPRMWLPLPNPHLRRHFGRGRGRKGDQSGPGRWPRRFGCRQARRDGSPAGPTGWRQPGSARGRRHADRHLWRGCGGPRHGRPGGPTLGRAADGATIELRLRDGETVVPHEFLKKLSQQNHQGVFAVKEADGRLSLVVVAWDAVATATLRGLSELPKGLAE